MTRNQIQSWLTARFVTLTWVYFTILIGWTILHTLFGDRWAMLFLFNSFAEYLFVPLPLFVALAWNTQRREIWAGCAIGFAIVVFLYGGLWLPKSTPNSSNQALRVMTYNMLGFSEHPEAVVATIRASNSDLVAIQELNPPAAEMLQRDLMREYPYQILDPREGVTGAGVISRFPMRATGERMPGEWLGTPQILYVDWNGTPILVLHVHTFPSSFEPIYFLLAGDQVETTIRIREGQAQYAADFVAAHRNQPLIVTGDFNMTDQNTAYDIVSSNLIDAWREAGWGPGHTFPSNNFNGKPTVTVAGFSPLMWLARIDYIFHSPHWLALSADLAPWDGFSDHRPVVVNLILAK